MVRGLDIAVTAVALMYQCALMARMARGRGKSRSALAPKSRHAAVCRLTSKPFIGLPCPMNAAGIGDVLTGSVNRTPAQIAHRL